MDRISQALQGTVVVELRRPSAAESLPPEEADLLLRGIPAETAIAEVLREAALLADRVGLRGFTVGEGPKRLLDELAART